MLIGSKIQNEEIVSNLISQYSKLDIISICNIGSLAAGTWKYNSDCDLVVLYKGEAVAPRKKITVQNFEYTLIHLEWLIDMFYEEPVCYSYTDVNEAMQMLSSPYTFDPYGIVSDIKQIVERVADVELFKTVYLQRCYELFNFEEIGTKVNIKRYMTLLYTLSYLSWLLKFNEIPPISINVLKQNLSNDFRELVDKINFENNVWSKEMEAARFEVTHYSFKLITPESGDLLLIKEWLSALLSDREHKYSNKLPVTKKEVLEMVNGKCKKFHLSSVKLEISIDEYQGR